METKTNKGLYSILATLFAINTVPLIAEVMTTLAASTGSVWSIWSLCALAYILCMTEVDIYIISRPVPITEGSHIDRWRKQLANRLGFNTPAFIAIISLIKQAMAMIKDLVVVKRIRELKILLLSFGYGGMIIFTMIPGLGRIANAIYARNKQNLKYSRFILYFGCLVRFYLIYNGIELIIF